MSPWIHGGQVGKRAEQIITVCIMYKKLIIHFNNFDRVHSKVNITNLD